MNIFRNKEEAEGFKTFMKIDPIAAEKSMAAHIADIHPKGFDCPMCGELVDPHVNRPRMGGRIEYFTCNSCGYTETDGRGHNPRDAALVKCRTCGKEMSVSLQGYTRNLYFVSLAQKPCKCHRMGGQHLLVDGIKYIAIHDTSVKVLRRS